MHIETVERRAEIPGEVIELMRNWNATELYANIEYEVDELARDEKLINAAEGSRLRVNFLHDQCVVEPGTIVSGVRLY